MNRSEQINEPVAALAKAQAEMKDAVLNKVNPHFKNRYADLPAVRNAVTGPLSKNGLSAFQTMSEADGKTFLETTLAHTSGQWIQSVTPILVDKPGMQALGSGITYARRYALAAICGIASDEDDDGEGAKSDAPITPEQKETLIALLKETGADTMKFLAWAKVESVDDLPAGKFSDAVELLKAKKARK